MKKKIVFCVLALIFAAVLLSSLLFFILDYLPEKKREDDIIRAFKEYYDQKIALYLEENKNYDDFEVDIAFIGDSLTDGYDLEHYYPEYTVENRGIGGDTTHGLLARLDASVYQLKPKVIVMLIGANNLDTMFDNYEDIIMCIRENLPKTELVICSLTSMGKDWGKNNQKASFNNVKIKAYAEKHDCNYVDLYTPLLNFETDEIYEHYTTDGGHLTPDGYLVITASIKPVIDSILKNDK